MSKLDGRNDIESEKKLCHRQHRFMATHTQFLFLFPFSLVHFEMK